jgi:hypothetical protein
MTVEELAVWAEFYSWEARETEKALNKAGGGKKRNRMTIGGGSKRR